MKKLTTLTILFTLAVAFEAQACRCMKVSDFFETSQDIFSQDSEALLVLVQPEAYLNRDGTLSAERTFDPEIGYPQAEGVSFNVLGLLKGPLENLDSRVLIKFGGTSCSPQPYSFEVQQKYLVILQSSVDGQGVKNYTYAGHGCNTASLLMSEL